MTTEVKELIEEIKGSAAQIQKRTDVVEARGQKTEEQLEKALVEIGDMTEKLQTIVAAAEAEAKAREELEMRLARIPEGKGGNDMPLGDRDYKKGFRSYMRKGSVTILEHLEAEGEALQKAFDLEEAENVKALAVGSGPDGGFLVPTDTARLLTQRVFESSPIRQIANVITTANESVEIVIDDDEADSGWAGEVETPSETGTPGIGLLTIPTHEQRAMPKATQKLLDDASIDIESWLQGHVSRKFTRMENTGFVTGNGVKKPRGFTDYEAWADEEQYERGKLAQIQTSTNDDLDEPNDLINLQTLLLEEYQANARWVMNRRTWGGKVIQLKNAVSGDYLISPALLFSGVEPQLLGKPVVLAADMPVVANAAKIIAYGDFREGYTIVDRIGIRVLRDPFTAKPYILFYTTKRVGGDVTNYQAIKILYVQ